MLCSQSLYFRPKSNNRVSTLQGELKPLGFVLSGRPVERLNWTSAGGLAAMGKNKSGVGSRGAERGAAGTPELPPDPWEVNHITREKQKHEQKRKGEPWQREKMPRPGSTGLETASQVNEG